MRKSNFSPLGSGPVLLTRRWIPGVAGFDGGGEYPVPFDVLGSPSVLLPTPIIFRTEGLGMTAGGGGMTAPFGGIVTVGEFDEIEVAVLDIGIDIADGDYLGGVELAGHAAIEDGQGFGADIFGQLKIFQKAKAEGLVIIGGGAGGRTRYSSWSMMSLLVLYVADGFLPLVAVGEVAAFDDTAAGEANKARVHVGEELDEVGAEAAGPLSPGSAAGEEWESMVEVVGAPTWSRTQIYSWALGSVAVAVKPNGVALASRPLPADRKAVTGCQRDKASRAVPMVWPAGVFNSRRRDRASAGPGTGQKRRKW